MVMEALLATLIVGLFSLWVWSLKQEIEELRKTDAPEPSVDEHAPVHHATPQPQRKVGSAWQHDVPTWKLD